MLYFKMKIQKLEINDRKQLIVQSVTNSWDNG